MKEIMLPMMMSFLGVCVTGLCEHAKASNEARHRELANDHDTLTGPCSSNSLQHFLFVLTCRKKEDLQMIVLFLICFG